MKTLVGIGLVAVVLGASFFLLQGPRVIDITGEGASTATSSVSGAATLAAAAAGGSAAASSSPTPVLASTSTQKAAAVKNGTADLPNQLPLANPPAAIHGLYLTSWSAGSSAKVEATIAFMKRTGLNAVVIDIKDYSGYLAYRTGIPEAVASGAESDIRILRPNAVIKRFHDEGFYIIGRVTVFQDPIIAKAHPEWALQSKTTGKTWTDNNKLAWLDAAGKPAWDYVVSIAKDAIARGFDEVNFDYIRFASDGNLSAIAYPFWDMKTSRASVIAKFFAYLRQQLAGARISADLFGLSTVNHDDLGIGQVIESAYRNFDYVCPMVYPSHYATGFLGYTSPAKYPYEVIKYSMDHARARLEVLAHPVASSSTSSTSAEAASSMVSTSSLLAAATSTPPAAPVPILAKLRPWLQAFDLGAIYTSAMINKEIKAVTDAAAGSDTTNGWLLWNPANTYGQFQPAATSTNP